MKNIHRDADGVYRWEYALNLYKNPALLFLIWKIMGWIMFGLWLLIGVTQCFSHRFRLSNFTDVLPVFLGIAAFLLVLCAIGYYIYAALMGGSYIVRFELDEQSVTHTQLPSQAKRSRKIAFLAALIGLFSDDIGATGGGVAMAAAPTTLRTEFAKVKSIKANRKRHLIGVGETLYKNLVYAGGEDYDFVLDFITSRCPNAKKIIK